MCAGWFGRLARSVRHSAGRKVRRFGFAREGMFGSARFTRERYSRRGAGNGRRGAHATPRQFLRLFTSPLFLQLPIRRR